MVNFQQRIFFSSDIAVGQVMRNIEWAFGGVDILPLDLIAWYFSSFDLQSKCSLITRNTENVAQLSWDESSLTNHDSIELKSVVLGDISSPTYPHLNLILPLLTLFLRRLTKTHPQPKPIQLTISPWSFHKGLCVTEAAFETISQLSSSAHGESSEDGQTSSRIFFVV